MLNKDVLLSRTNNGLDVFKHYISGQWRVGRNFHNPLYEDRKASCNIYFDRRSQTYKMKDFGNDFYSGDCFDIVGKIRGLDCNNPKEFIEILKTINRDLSLGIDENDDSFVVSVSLPESKGKKQPENSPIPSPKKEKPYSAVSQSFSVKEKEFWAQYGITAEILKTYKVVSLKEFRSENNDCKPFTLYSTDNEPMFGYQGKRHIKIYHPFSDIRFLYGGLLPDNYCFGLEQLPAKGDTLFITGGEGTGKSNYVGSLIAGTIREKENIDTLGTAIQQNCANKAVLLYDTEQS
ncbi:MAG: hypothetical protein LBR66_03985, partial [Candidatus Symbiothrix sp.]|nr:hypothetical protein [Candidatus Symbiothrix sp.]